MVYVDPARHPYRGMLMCHMMADTTEELLDMADRIGVQRKWIQKEGTVYEHFDIAKSKRALAVAAGAKEVTSRDLGLLILQRRQVKSIAVQVSDENDR